MTAESPLCDVDGREDELESVPGSPAILFPFALVEFPLPPPPRRSAFNLLATGRCRRFSEDGITVGKSFSAARFELEANLRNTVVACLARIELRAGWVDSEKYLREFKAKAS